MSDLDRYLAVPTGQDDVDPLVRDLREEQRHRASANIVASGGNPDHAGRANQLSREFGLPPETVERNLPSVEDLQRQRKAVKLMERYPAIGSWSAEPRNAAVARDDLDSLGAVAKVFAGFKNVGKSLMAGTANLTGGLYGIGEALETRDPISMAVAGALNAVGIGTPRLKSPVTRWFKERRKESEAYAAGIRPQTGNFVADGLLTGVESIPTTAAALGMAALGNPGTGLALFGGSTAGQSFGQARDQGLSPEQSAAFGVSQGAVEVATEASPFGFMVNALGRVGLPKFLAGFLGRELVGEELATVLQSANEWITLNPDKPASDFFKELPEAMAETALATTAMGGAAGALHIGVSTLNKRRAAAQAKADAAFLNDLGTASIDSKVRKRDPSAFARFLGMQAEGTAVENLYIPGETIRELYQSNDMDWHDSEDPFFGFDPSIAGQIDQAIATGGDVVVKTADFATHLAGTPAWDALKDHVRASPDGMSLAEAQEWEGAFDDAMNATGEEFAALVEADRAEMEPRQKIAESIRDKLMLAGYRPDVAITNAELVASRATARAARLGVQLTGDEYADLEVTQILPEKLAKVQALDGLDMVIATLKRGRSERSDSAKFGPSLLEFIAKRGGVEDRGGDIESMGGRNWHRGKVGRRKLLRDVAQGGADLLGDTTGNDNTPDALALAAWEAGYFPNMAERPSVDQFLEAVGQELGGRPVYAEDRTGKADEMAAAADELRGLLEQQGLDPDKASTKDIKAAVSRYQSEAMEGRTLDQPVFHGSPHIFDRFSLDHIGSGEGAQAYGWGLYFSGRKEIADFYRKTLAGESLYLTPDYAEYFTPGRIVEGYSGKDKVIEFHPGPDDMPWDWSVTVKHVGEDGSEIPGERPRRHSTRPSNALMQEVLGRGPTHTPGRLYEVEIPEDGEYLLWDKPLSEQPEKVKAALAKIGLEPPALPAEPKDAVIASIIRDALKHARKDAADIELTINNDSMLYNKGLLHAERAGVDTSDIDVGEYVVLQAADYVEALQERELSSGERLYKQLAIKAIKGVPDRDGENANGHKAASEILHEAGIAGIKYLDGGSRTDGDGTFNYVVFDDNAVSIRSYNQSFMEGPRGRITFAGGKNVIELYEQRDMSTFLHETGHLYLEELWVDAGLSEAVAADKQAVIDWFKSNGIAMPDDGTIPTEAHELWARGFERFAMEGKAPSSALRKAFDAFRSWLLTIYKVVDNLRSPISPEVRGVMERLLATDEEIAAAAEEQNIRALFTTAQEAGMTDEAFAEYQRAAGEARDEAHDALLYRTMAAIRREKTKAWKEEEAGVRAAVTERVDGQPLFRALRALTTGRVGDAEPQRIKLDRAWLVETYGPDVLGLLPTRVPPIYAESATTNADMIAEMTGFPTGDEMVRTLMGLNSRQKELREGGDKRSVRQVMIDEETASAMRERHGDPLNDGSIEDEARALIHNDKQGEVIASELRSLARRANKRPTPYAIARQWAAERIASGTVTETVSGAALARYERAARKAGKLAEEAMLAGDIDETYRQKQAQMLNNALIAEGKKAKDAVDAAVARLGKLAKRKTIKSLDQGHLDQVHALLEQVEFRPRSQRSLDRQESFEEWAAAQQAAGFDVAVPPSFATSLGTTHWSRLSVEQLRGLDDTVKQIVHLGRLKQKLLDGQEQRAFDELVDEAVAGMDGMPRKPVVDGFLDPSYPQKAWSFVLGLDAVMLKMETVFDWLDQGNPNGVFNRVVFQRFVDAQEQRRLRLNDMNAKLEAARQKIPEGIRKRWSRKVSLNLIDPETGRPAVMTGDQLIAMALNMGNASNAGKLADGYSNEAVGVMWTEDAILAELNRELTVEEWQYVQDVWDTINTLWPDIEAMERRVNGVAPPKIEPRVVETKAGVLRGGYYPVVYDPARNLEAERHAADDSDKLFANGYRRATTQAGSTHERTNVNRPILLSLSVISRHVGEVIHDITHREAVIDTNRFLNNPTIVRNIRETLGVEVQKQMQPWLRHIANEWASDAMGTAALEKFVKGMRTNATFVGMAYRWSTIKMQVAGLFNSIETVGARWIGDGVVAFSKSPIETTRFVLAASQEVSARLDNNDRDIRDAIKREQSRLGFVSNVKIFGFHMIGYSDRFVSVVTWMGAYNRALSEGMTEQQAVAFADKTVRRSQGSGAAKDLAAIQRGKGNAGEAGKLLTMFYSYMSAFYQRQRTLGRDFNKAFRDGAVGDFPGLLARTMWLYFFPALVSELLAGRGPDDDEDWTEWMVSNIATAALGPIPVVRDIAGGVASGFGYNFTPASGIGRTAVNLWNDGKHIWEGEETKRATRNVMEGVGYVTGAVPGQLAASTQFLVDVAYGEQSPETVGDWWEGLTKGKIKD